MATTIDDADLTYTGDWTHATDGSANLVDGTQSYTNDPSATFSFSFTGTGFDFCAGLKADRGAFTYTIDGATQGAGTQRGDDMANDPVCTVVAQARGLTPGNHQVVFQNSGTTYFGADSVTTYANDAAALGAGANSPAGTTSTVQVLTTSSQLTTSTTTITSSPSTTTVTSTRQTASLFSISLGSSPSASSSTSASASAGTVAAAAEGQGYSQLSAGKKAAMIGGPIVGAAVLAALGFFLFMRYRRKRSDRETAIAPSASSHWLDEKQEYQDAPRDYRYSGNLDMYEKPTMLYGNNSTSSPERRSPMQQLAGRISPIGLGRSKSPGHSRLNSEMSLESNTEPFQPTELPASQLPSLEPFHIPPHSEEMRASIYPAQASIPAPAPATLRPDQYRSRLAAAASALPDWRASQQSSYYAETELPDLPDTARNSNISHLPTDHEYASIYAGMLSTK